MILDGKKLAEQIKNEVREECSKFEHFPSLAIVSVGEDLASMVYIKQKIKACVDVGIIAHCYAFKSISENQLIDKIKNLKEDGIIVQLPLPDEFDERRVLDAIDPAKDVDGLTTTNIGKLHAGLDCFIPCTPAGIIELIKTQYDDLSGLRAVIVGRSHLVGRPLAELLLQQNCTVTVCHSKTEDLSKQIKDCEILIVAVGKPEMISSSETNALIIIDVGINRVDGKLVGDVLDDAHSAAITPVPGGVGPMTVAMLLKNIVRAAK